MSRAMHSIVLELIPFNAREVSEHDEAKPEKNGSGKIL